MASSDKYVNPIRMLKGPDRIRLRPSVIFGSNGLDGLKNMVLDILNIFTMEARLGYCRDLTVIQKGAAWILQGNDRGIWLGHGTEDTAAWERIFDGQYCPPTNSPEDGGYTFNLHFGAHHILYGDPEAYEGAILPENDDCFALYCAQCVCKEMDVVSNRNGIRKALHFEKGINIGGIKTRETDAENGSVFYLEPDDTVFTETKIPESFFLKILDQYALLLPGLVCTYINEETGTNRKFSYPAGIADYTRKKTVDDTPVYYYKIAGSGKDRYNRPAYEATVEVSIAYTPFAGETHCFHNCREIPYGGTHYVALQERLCEAFNDCFRPEREVTFEELSKHLTIVLSTECTPRCTDWENGTRKSICNKMITDMTRDIAGKPFDNYLYENKKYFSRIDAVEG